MNNEKCSKEHVTCAFYNTKNSMHCASCRHRVLFLSEQLLAEQAKNKKLVEALEEISGCTQHKSDFCNHQSDCSFCRMRQAQQALNEVSNAK